MPFSSLSPTLRPPPTRVREAGPHLARRQQVEGHLQAQPGEPQQQRPRAPQRLGRRQVGGQAQEPRRPGARHQEQMEHGGGE